MANLWDIIAQWRGAQNILWDLVDRPEFMHQIMGRLTDAYMAMLDQAEEKGLLGYAADHHPLLRARTPTSCPPPGSTPTGRARATCGSPGMAQIFSTVSPAMHQEFELDYVNPLV